MEPPDAAPVPCVGAIVHDDAGRLLLVLRGHAPSAGLWSVPGGRREPGETDAEAVRREVLEETALPVLVGTAAGTVVLAGDGGPDLRVVDFRCTLAPGTRPSDARAGDDAADVGWFTHAEVATLPMVPGLLSHLAAWGSLPG